MNMNINNMPLRLKDPQLYEIFHLIFGICTFILILKLFYLELRL
jgi:hypothetical protein